MLNFHPDTTVKLDGGVEAKMCPICNGMGIVSEEYNHRVMQKMCLQCNGEGVKVLKNGVEVKAAEGANRSDDLMVARKQSLEVELAKIQEKIKSLQEESAAITSGLLNDSDQEGRKLMEALVCQLTMQIDRLEKIQTSSQAKLNNLGKP